jgi:hypothetical protein
MSTNATTYVTTCVTTCVLGLSLCLLAPACGGGEETEAGEGETGASTPGATLILNFDASSFCDGGGVERVEFATRRVDCWDPELPCTVSQDPPWLTGTTRDCGELDGEQRWEVTVGQTGKYETQLRALAGDMQQGVHCFATGALSNTHVANEDLESNAELVLGEIADSECSNP